MAVLSIFPAIEEKEKEKVKEVERQRLQRGGQQKEIRIRPIYQSLHLVVQKQALASALQYPLQSGLNAFHRSSSVSYSMSPNSSHPETSPLTPTPLQDPSPFPCYTHILLPYPHHQMPAR